MNIYIFFCARPAVRPVAQGITNNRTCRKYPNQKEISVCAPVGRYQFQSTFFRYKGFELVFNRIAFSLLRRIGPTVGYQISTHSVVVLCAYSIRFSFGAHSV